MATLTNRLLVLESNGETARNNPADLLQVGSSWETTGTGTFAFNSTGALTMSGPATASFTPTGALTLTGGAASTWSTSAGALTITSAAAATWSTAGGGLSVAGATALALDSNNGTLSINATGGAIRIGNDADNQAIQIGQGGTRTITIGTSNAPVTIGGDLVVTGSTVSTSSETVLIADNHLYLNAGYATVSAVTGGLVVNYLPTATNDTVAATGFVAGVAATSNPTVNTVGAATFALSDLIQIASASNPSNNGLFEVLSHAANLLTIRGVGTTAAVQDFTQNQFVTDTTVAGTIRKVSVSVIRAGTDGAWETAVGSTTGLTFADLATAGGSSLQSAYVAGNTITVTSGEGPLAITLTSDDFTVNGANDVDFGGTTPVSTFNVDATGAVTIDGTGISIDGTSSSNFSTTAAALTISTITSGALSVTSAGILDIDAASTLSINSSGGVINIGDDAVGQNLNVGTGAAARNITIGNATTSTGIAENSGTGGHLIDSTGIVEINSSGAAISIGNDAVAQAINIGTGAAARTISIGNGTGASAVTIVSGTGNINIGVNAVAHTVAIGNQTGASTLTLDSGTGRTVLDTSSVAVNATAIRASGNNYITLDNRAVAAGVPGQRVVVGQYAEISTNGAGFSAAAGEAFVVGSVVTIKLGVTTNQIFRADADGTGVKTVAGIAMQASSGSADVAKIHTLPGVVVPMVLDAATTAAADEGKVVYLSATVGVGTLTAPTASGSVVFRVGLLQTAGASTTQSVLFMPQFIANNP